MLEILLRYLLAFNELSATTATTTTSHTLKRSPRIVGGTIAEVEQIPYLVNIRKKGVFQCGGSLVTPKCVLTAAHCVKDGTSEDFVVRGGVTYLNDLRNSRKVENIFVSPKYDSKTFDHDVAIFQLKSELKGKNIETIAISTEGPETGEFIKVSGWGLRRETASNPSNQMRTVRVRVFEQQACAKLYNGYRNVTGNMFCASIPGIRDACSADSGGPAVSRNNQLVGVVSWGKGAECARVGSPGVYVNLREIKHWVESVLGKHCY